MTERRPATSLTRLGLTDPRAEAVLTRLGWWREGGPAVGTERALWALARSPDPDLALRTLERLADALGAAGWRELDPALRTEVGLRGRLLAVLGSSTALGDHLIADPGRWRRLRGDGTPLPDVGGYTATLLRAVGANPAAPPPGTPGGAHAELTGSAAVAALRGAYRDEVLDVAAADLAAVCEPELAVVPLPVVAARLADLAAAALRAALAVAGAEVNGPEPKGPGGVTGRLAVIGMGKCGGRELNYVSDVDVVFVVEAADEIATRTAAALMRVAGAACFQVDAALRPEGRSGALVRALDGHVAYYRRWAQTWEFQALLKARPVAGDPELGKSYVDAVAPLVWQAADREDFVADVQAMRRRVERHVPSDLVDRELKLGRGGLRDVEFAVQLLQLVHGRSDEQLRVRSTVDALAALGVRGYVGRDDAANLAASYEFLRLLEHRLQLQRMRRTHLFPAEDDRPALRWLARAARMRPDGRRDAVGVLLSERARNALRVRRLHEKLFYRPLLEAVARVPTEDLRLTPAQATVRLAALGYASPQGALAHLQALTTGVSRAATIQTALLPVLLDQLADTPDPDGGLLAYRRVSEALETTPWYLRLLRDEGAVAQRLMYLLGTSKMVPDLLVRAPEVLRLLADTGPRAELATRDPAEAAVSLCAAVSRHDDPGHAAAAARSLRRYELLRIACADLLGLLEIRAVCEALTASWAAVLSSTVDVAVRRLGRDGAPARVAVVGMGRLGGSEQGYGSDADVLFVCDPVPGAEETAAVRFGTAVAESVCRVLGAPNPDPALVVDADLRPEGRNGPLVRTLASYRAYYAQWAQVWEAQALLRARPVAGDRGLGAEFVAAVADVRYPPEGLAPAKVTEIRRIKARVDSERLPRGADRATHTKLGHGGLADVEWTVQLLQLQYAGMLPGLRTTSTVDGLRQATAAGVLDEADAAALEAGWVMATRARNAVTLVRGKPSDALPRPGRGLAAVARVMGHPAGGDSGAFVDEYRRATRRARAVVERIFYGS